MIRAAILAAARKRPPPRTIHLLRTKVPGEMVAVRAGMKAAAELAIVETAVVEAVAVKTAVERAAVTKTTRLNLLVRATLLRGGRVAV